MIAILLTEMVSALSPATFATTDSGGGPVWLLVFGPVGAGGVYYGLWRHYRNTHRSHAFEKETRIGAQPVTGNDSKVNEIKGTKKSGIDGDNRRNHRQRVQRLDQPRSTPHCRGDTSLSPTTCRIDVTDGAVVTSYRAAPIGAHFNTEEFIMSFAHFMAGPIGRGVRVLAGIGLVVAGLFVGSAVGWLLAIVGVVAFLAGALNVCLLAPLLKAPFSGKEALSDHT